MTEPVTGDELREFAEEVKVDAVRAFIASPARLGDGQRLQTFAEVFELVASDLDALAADLARAREPDDTEGWHVSASYVHKLGIINTWHDRRGDEALRLLGINPWGDERPNVPDCCCGCRGEVAAECDKQEIERLRDHVEELEAALDQAREPVGDEVVDGALGDLESVAFAIGRHSAGTSDGELLLRRTIQLRTRARQQAERIAGLEAQKVPDGWEWRELFRIGDRETNISYEFLPTPAEPDRCRWFWRAGADGQYGSCDTWQEALEAIAAAQAGGTEGEDGEPDAE